MKTQGGIHKVQRIPETPWPSVQKLAREYETKLAERAATKRHLDELGRRHGRATQEDERALAQAIRAGKPAPALEEVEDLDHQIEAARRLLDAYESVVEDVDCELRTLVDEHRGAWLEETRARIVEARAELAEGVAAVARLYAESLEPALVLEMWLREFPHGKPYKRPAPTLVRVGRAEDVSVTTLLGAIASALVPDAAAEEVHEDAG